MRILFLLSLAMSIASGCHLPSHAPDPNWIADLQRADRMRLESKDGSLEISDPQAVDRMRKIYAQSEWEPYWDTLMVDPENRSVTLYDGATKLRSFGYAGGLSEAGSYTDVRTAALSEVDREWFDSLFATISQSDDKQLSDLPVP